MGVLRADPWRRQTGDRPLSFPSDADVAQLVEHHLAKVRVAGSNLVVRSIGTPCSAGGSSVFLGLNRGCKVILLIALT